MTTPVLFHACQDTLGHQSQAMCARPDSQEGEEELSQRLASERVCQHTVLGESKSEGDLAPLGSQDEREGGQDKGQHLAIEEVY